MVVVCLPGPTLLFFIFRFEYLISGPKSYRDVRENGPLVPVVQKVDKTIHWKMHLSLYNAYPRDSYLSGG